MVVVKINSISAACKHYFLDVVWQIFVCWFGRSWLEHLFFYAFGFILLGIMGQAGCHLLYSLIYFFLNLQ